MRLLYIISLVFILTSCGKISAPSLLSPSQNTNVKVSYGGSPADNYPKILKDYLKANLNNYKTAKVEFINEPAKLSINHLGDTYSGYRVCLSINERRGDYYLGYRNHFFMIKNNKINLHLFDSGLLTIPFEYCVTRNIEKELYIDDIPDKRQEVAIEKMDEIKIAKLDKKANVMGNTFISCKFQSGEFTYVFNESNRTFKLLDKLKEKNFDVNFNEAFIVATVSDTELSINRVTGKATILNKSIINGNCKLTDRTKF